MIAHKRKRGFALLITVTLLAFLVLLLVSLSSLTRVETQVADNGQKLTKAQQNAMAGLNIAIGQLQKYAGPDKVVSARADITSAGSLQQPYLTGIWKISNVSSTPEVWLVSGNESSPVSKNPTNVGDPTTGTEPVVDGTNGYVFLIGSNTVSTNAQRVRVAKQPISANAGTIPGITAAATVGNYAYWVGDEGMKASASLINPLLGPNTIAYDNATGSSGQGDDWTNETAKRARLDQLQLSRPRLEKFFTTGPFDPDGSNALASLPKVQNRQQLALMVNSPTPTVLKQYFHALAPLSQAVLVDVTNGRLKKDLSDVSVTPDPAILSFQQTRLTNPATGYTATYTPVKASVATAATYPAYSLGPVLTEFGIRLNFYVGADTKVYCRYVIDAELWNPYAAELHLGTGAANALTIEIQDGLPAFSIGGTSYTPTIPAVAVDAATVWGTGAFNVLRGQTALGPVSGTITFSDADTGATGSIATPPTVTSAATTANLKVVLKVGSDVLATYTPTLTFSAASATANTSATGWLFGYGYEFADNLETFTNGDATTAFDPRLPVLSGAFHQATSTVWDHSHPDANTGGIGSATTFNDTTTIALFDLPRQEVTSLGMLTHVIGAKPYTVGNSWGGAANLIFDQYHVSTVPRFATAWTPESGLPLPNRYESVYHPDPAAALALADLRSVDRSARYLLQNGAFNINSTSIDAWTAVLGSKFSAWKYSVDPITGIALDNVFFRLPHGAQQLAIPPVLSSVTTGTSAFTDDNVQKAGGRQLTDMEIADPVTGLARKIVDQIRAHGRPYASLQDFINSGVIANAITAAGLNSTLSASKRFAPGALTQADVIGAIAPFIAARSDTFLVRAYGDAQNPVTGAVEGRAWCEAVVQRLPELADNASAPIADVITPNTTTYPFGRKFKIVSFRWLTSSDI
ncbi:MAG: hypothetical protein WC205_14055 [Opitutaceae bacterium]